MLNHNGREKKMAAALAVVNGLGLLTPLTAPLAATFEDNGAAEAAKIIKGGGQLVDRLYFKTAAAYTPTVSSGTVSGETVAAGQEQTVTDGGIVSNTIVSGFLAEQYVESGGRATGTTINECGQQFVRSGGSATSTTINSLGVQMVSDNGSATDTTINSIGQQIVYDNGSATSTTINSGGFQSVYNGGSATDTTINSGGEQVVVLNGSATGTTINSGGTQRVYANGSATDTTINGGNQIVSSGGSATDTTINGGNQIVSSGGSATDTTINSGGTQRVGSGGIATGTTINNSGNQEVYSGGSATGTTINSGGTQWVSVGGSATGTTINSGGQQWVSVGASATGTTINSGGTQWVSSSAIAKDTTINSGGLQVVSDNSSATDTTINNGGEQCVAFHGSVSNTTINNGGTQEVMLNGSASGTIINSGGTQKVLENGSATGTTINNGGLQTVASGGTAVSTTVKSGGKQTVSSGGTIISNVVERGGIQELAEGAIVSGDMTLNGTLEIGGNMSLGGTGDVLMATEGSMVRFTSGGSPKTLNIGTLQGSTNFVINTDIANDSSDKIVIQDATGSTNTVQIGYDACFASGTGAVAKNGGVTFATVSSGGTASTFTAKSTEFSAYKFTPTIEQSGNDYNITNIISEAGSLVYNASDMAAMELMAIRAENNNLTKRMGELRRSDKASGVWVRSYGGEQTVDTSIRRAEQNYHGLQGGYDKVKNLGNGKLFAGYTVGYLKATGDLERGDSDNSSLSLGLYGSWLGDKGHYFDIIAKRSRQNNSYRTYLDNLSGTRLDADYRTHGTTLGMEYGYRKELKDGYYLEPQAELIYSRIGGVDYKVSDGTEASQSSIRSLIGRIGATYGKRTDHQNYYIKLSAAREFTAKERVRMHLGSMSAVGMEESLKESWLEIALGLTGTAGRNSDYYVELTKTTGDKVKEDWQASVGIRWKF